MTQRNARRRRAPFCLTLGALVAAASYAAADDAQVSHVEGYPRTSDAPPPAIDGNTDGYGEYDEDDDGESYDTNWFFDADRGDSNVVLLMVHGASIDGYGHVADGDASSATHEAKSAWGEDRLVISAPTTGGEQVQIHITNKIRVAAAWVLDGNGWNDAVLRAEALDINGTVHTWRRTLHVDPELSATSTESETTNESSSVGGDVGAGTDDASASASGSTSGTSSDTSSSTETVSSSEAICDDDEVSWDICRTHDGVSCTVKIASTELIDLRAQAMVDGRETTTKVSYFDTVNVVSATYVLDPPPPAEGPGPGTPPGEEDGGPTTPPTGGDDGGGPTTPSGDDDEPTPPGDEKDDDPVTPDDAPLPPSDDPLKSTETTAWTPCHDPTRTHPPEAAAV